VKITIKTKIAYNMNPHGMVIDLKTPCNKYTCSKPGWGHVKVPSAYHRLLSERIVNPISEQKIIHSHFTCSSLFTKKCIFPSSHSVHSSLSLISSTIFGIGGIVLLLCL
jgi:hypothetical protein